MARGLIRAEVDKKLARLVVFFGHPFPDKDNVAVESYAGCLRDSRNQ